MKKLRKMEWWILICAIILCGIGLVALFSASYDSNLDEFKKQAVWIGVSLGIMIVIMFIERKYKVKKIKERKNSIKILQCIVMFVMAVISFWIYVSVLTGKFNHYMMLVFLVEIIDAFMVTLVIKIFRNLIDIYFDWKENKRCEGMD